MLRACEPLVLLLLALLLLVQKTCITSGIHTRAFQPTAAAAAEAKGY
jgi:hypothetical protein